MEVAYFSPNMFLKTSECKCEKISKKGKIVSVCDICSEKNFLKRSSSPSYQTDSSTFTEE